MFLIFKSNTSKKLIYTFLITVLIISWLAFTREESHAVTVEQTVTKYHLDIGAQQVWGMGKTLETAVWDNGVARGGSTSIIAELEFPREIKNVKAFPYSSTLFKWGEDEYTFNGNGYLTRKKDFDENYLKYTSTLITNIKANSSGKKVNLNYNAVLASLIDFNLKEELNKGNLGKILELMGGENVVKSKYPDIYKKLLDGAYQTMKDNIYGFMYFTPVIIQYDVTEQIEIGDLEAKLGLPLSANTGEEYTIEDKSMLSNNLTVAKALLEERVGSKYFQICTWNGTDRKGENTGGSTKQKSEIVGEKTYRLTVTTKEGQSDIDERTIQITDGTKIEGKATLILPQFTYEGHPTPAEDDSTFSVEGVQYTARRAYEEGIARNDFVTVPYSAGTVSQSGRNPTEATAVFPRRGNYSVKLNIDLKNGGFLSDIKPIEVRKTPYIIDSLGGFQKQNRKQILVASVATYPGKPITDYYIKIKDLNTGEEINLTKSNPQGTNAVIKTRQVKKNGDQYWTNFELEFLTKLQGEFRYTIYALDSKGDSDIQQKDFTVRPDLPPKPEIIISDTFLRNKGTNIAEIVTEDASTTDGDQLNRVWTLEGLPVEMLSGFEDKSFGSRQKVKFEKTGVGKLDLRLHVKDVWNEPTLEEYITSDDYLEAETTADSQVINIAPTVKVKPVTTKEVDMIIVAGKTSMPEISAKLNSLKAEFIENTLDPNFSLVGVTNADEGLYRKVATWQWGTTVNCRACQSNKGQMDTDFAYRVTSPGKMVSGYQEICVSTGPHVVEALCPGDEKCRCVIDPNTGIKASAGEQHVVWSYPINESANFGMFADNMEKYIYITLSDKGSTLLLNRNNGAFITELNFILPGSPIITTLNENLYFANGSTIQKYDMSKNTISTVANQGGSLLSLQGGKIVFIGKRQDAGNLAGGGKGLYVGQFDIKTELVREIAIANLQDYAGAVSGYDMDSYGNVLLGQPGKLWMVDTKTQESKAISGLGVGENMNCAGFVKDETGRARYVYQAYNTTTYKNYGYFYFRMFDFSGDKMTQVASYNGEFTGYNWNPVTYAKLHSRENNVYILQGADWMNFDMYTPSVRGQGLRINLNNMSVNFNYNTWGWDVAEELGGYNETYMKTFFKEDRWHGQTDRLKLFRNSITEEEALTTALSQKGYFSQEAVEKIIAIYGNEQFEALKNNPIFINFADENGAKFIGGSTDEHAVVEDVKDKLKEGRNVLKITGTNEGGVRLAKNFMLEPDSQYIYRYFLTSVTGTALDIFRPVISKIEGGDNLTSKVLVSENYAGFGSSIKGHSDWGGSHTFNANYDMAEDGYIEFDYAVTGSRGSYSMTLDGRILEQMLNPSINFSAKASVFLPKGKHNFNFYGSVGRSDRGSMSMNNIRLYYLKKQNTEYRYNPLKVEAGKGRLIENNFKTPAEGAFNVLEKSQPIKLLKENFTGNAVSLTKYLSFTNRGNWNFPWKFSEASGTASLSSGYYNSAEGYFRVQAPADKGLIFSFKEAVRNPINSTPSHGGGRMLSPTTVMLKPGEVYSRSYYLNRESYQGAASISNIKIIELDPAEYDLNRVFLINEIKNIYLSNEIIPFDEFEISGDYYIVTKYVNLNQKLQKSVLAFNTIDTNMKNFESNISDFRLYRVLQGKEQLVLKENFNSLEAFRKNQWELTETAGGSAKILSGNIPEKKQEDDPLIYKKGQLIKYSIFYEDYENDPSKRQYWKYTHTPFNDGPHPDAAIILDEEGHSIVEKPIILQKPIDRFYIDGKYTVEHWQEDNTARSETPKDEHGYPLGNPEYDKISNIEALTFYVEGGASAPWITSIKTDPKVAKEGSALKVQVGVDDKEKDELNLTTEVYKNKKLIYSHRQKSLVAVDIGNEVKGDYPTTITGNVPSSLGGSNYKMLAGNYEVVCTVRDKTGAGLGYYKFTVISEGKITGYVNHTDKWEENRKKYNIKRPAIGDEETPRSRNTFWSGEKFMLLANLAGNPTKVTSRIEGYPSYTTNLKSTGKKNGKDETIYDGSLWNKSMINKWGRKHPETLTFRFTAFYEGDVTKVHDVNIIINSKNDYYQLHRLF